VRFGPIGLSASMLGVAVISGWDAIHGRGAFVTFSAADSVVSLHILLTVFALPLMLMTALLAERRSSEETLGNARSVLIHAHEHEYHRIARELHTNIAGQLTLMGLGVDEIRGASSACPSPLLDKLYDQISSATNTMLRLSHKIHPFSVEYLGLTRALKKLCRDTAVEKGITINSSVEDVPPNFPLDVSLRIFRLAQLALEDIQGRRAKTATVELLVDARRVLLRTADDGVGFDLPCCETIGLAYVREQALSLGGTLNTMAIPNKGLVTEASIPIPQSVC
jgi:signal transduction histidine kinase